MGFSGKAGLFGSVVAVALVCGTGAWAESLHDALLEAYRKNPALNAARAGQRATDELVPQALSGWRPTVSASGSVGANAIYATANPGTPANLLQPNGGAATETYTNPWQENVSIKLNQPLFRGFRTTENTAVAEASVRQGREQLLASEQVVLLNVVSAYVNLLRDRQVVDLRKKDLDVLQGQQRATVARFQAGVLTRTDVAQADAGVASQRAALAAATATMQSSEASFQQYVGHAPGKLSSVPFAQPPKSMEEALAIAAQTNPNILAASHAAEAAEHGIGVARSGLLPQADISGSYSFTANQNTFATIANQSTNSTYNVVGSVSVPIYEGGQVYSQVRQAKQRASQSKITVIDATRQVRQNVVTAWQGYLAARQSVASNTASVNASQLALNGVQQEYQVGSRSTVDVLNAELTLLNARIALASAQRDQLFTSYQLQAAMGHLTARHLKLGPIYDVKSNYYAVRNKWIGTDADVLK